MSESKTEEDLSDEQRVHLLCIECFVHGKLTKGGILAIGPPKCGKSTFGKYFALEAVKRARPVVYVTVDEPPDELEQSLQEVIQEPKFREMISIVDCYSWRTGLPPTGNYTRVNPKNLTELSLTFDKLAKESEKGCFILDSLSSVVLDAGPEPTRTFLQVLLARMKVYNAVCLSSLAKGIHKEDYEQTLRSMFDGILEFKIQEEADEIRRFIRIYVMKGAQHSTAWHRFITTPNGFKFPDWNSLMHVKHHLSLIRTS